MTLEAFTRELVDDDSVSVDEVVDRVTARLVQQPDSGVGDAIDCLLTTGDARIASYATNYLALLPGLHEEKTRVADRLCSDDDLATAAAPLVPWLSAGLLERIAKAYVEGDDPEGPLVDVVFSIAMYHPGVLRPYLERIEDVDMRLGMMSGAPDEYVPGLVAEARQRPGALDLLARMRSEPAARALLDLRADVPDTAEWETYVEMAGLLPDSGQSAGHQPAYLGSVVEGGRSPHVMGAAVAGPDCPACGEAAGHVLTLRGADLPFGLSGDPSFFWFGCGCYAQDSLTVRGVQAVDGPRALALEPHPNQAGISIDSAYGSSRHQVGGLPCWITPAAHPRCAECAAVMRYLVTVDSGPTPYGRMGFDGTLYGFWCDGCQVSTVVHQA